MGPKRSEAELLWERLLRVAPFDRHYRTERIGHFVFTREYERGIAEVERIRERDPEFADVGIAMSYMSLGRPEQAVPEWRATLTSRTREAFDRGIEEGGLQGGLRALRSPLVEQATQAASGFAWFLASLCAFIGEYEEAMTWLERAYEERDPLLLAAKATPEMDPLRSDPRFQGLLRRIGFPKN